MNTHVQIRNLPKSLHRKLKIRAASCDMTITDYVKRLIATDLAKPTLAEMVEELRNRPPVETSRSAAELIREDRDSR
jgi:plasmid stability protein